MRNTSLIRSMEAEALDEVLKQLIRLGALRRARLSGRKENEAQEFLGLLSQVVDGPEYPQMLEFAGRLAGRRLVGATAAAIRKAMQR